MLVAVASILAFVTGVVVGRDAPNAAAGGASPAPRDPPRLVIVGEPEEEPTAGVLEEVTYPDRLGSDGPPEERLRGLPLYARGAPRSMPDREPAAAAAGVAVREAADAAPPPESDPYTVQVAALQSADAAEEFAGRLLAKGFPAYVVAPAPDGPVAVYRVRVGRYADHGEAERVRQRLVQEEQLNPWITR